MEVVIMPDTRRAVLLSARLIAEQIRRKPDSTLGLATGRTMENLYSVLAGMHREEGLDFSLCRSFNLDEYIGLPEDDPNSYRSYMNQHLFSKVNMDLRNTHLPLGNVPDLEAECENYEKRMAECGGVDLQLLGIGRSGHIGFNEPADEFTKVTGEIDLTDSTIEANKRFFEKKEDVPRKAVSMGIGTIMRAKKIVLLVNGENKAEILKEVVNGPVTPKVPGSILQFHPHVTVICDEEAAKYL